ncbi:hypothetical protein CVT26_014681 [Gymnopilus dilepis]|uniref:Hydrophobin n=1 Tax=Gymnopilus dilepis TaxID=231916 RepID=A0A409W3F3_9AGAR|nr:hypothetical protein CVT26_014681 [Gymnopilus dilepis]
MLTRSSLVLLALPILAAAEAICTTGEPLCCRITGAAADSVIQQLESLEAILPPQEIVPGHSAVSCGSIIATGAGLSQCTDQLVCCTTPLLLYPSSQGESPAEVPGALSGNTGYKYKYSEQ